jgi:hypothetical protein
MLLSIDIDTSALWHTALIGFAAGIVAIMAAGSVIFSVDRASVAETRGQARLPWLAIAAIGGVVVAGVVVLGLWAMTQKS